MLTDKSCRATLDPVEGWLSSGFEVGRNQALDGLGLSSLAEEVLGKPLNKAGR